MSRATHDAPAGVTAAGDRKKRGRNVFLRPRGPGRIRAATSKGTLDPDLEELEAGGELAGAELAGMFHGKPQNPDFLH